MKKIASIAYLSAFFLLLGACSKDNQPDEPYAPGYTSGETLHGAMDAVTDVIVHDVFSPPIASRIYAYCSIAAYEAGRPAFPKYKSMAGQLTGLTPPPAPATGELDYELASARALLRVGKTLIFTESLLNAREDSLYATLRRKGNIPEGVFANSLAYGDSVANHILAWSNEDNYKQTRTFSKYTPQQKPSLWIPTPPAYMDGIEPHWREIRPFVLKSSDQFVPQPPTPFSAEKESKFYEEARAVYEALDEGNMDERSEIASFWDCNPYVTVMQGHLMTGRKKITPGGHWMCIAAIASRKANADLMKSAEAYLFTSLALADGFISCWDEKYRSNLVRPETYINRYIDQSWTPALQTPPFPEHTSGHSVISKAAAVALTHVFGEGFAFTDSTELEFGLTAREFGSFHDAADEAAISRFYGGIHYMPAIEYGVEQGEKVGKLIVANIEAGPKG